MLDAHVTFTNDQDLEKLEDDLSLSGVHQVIALCETITDVPDDLISEDGLVSGVVPRAQFDSPQFRVQLDACEHHARVSGLWSKLEDVSERGMSLLADVGFSLDVMSSADDIRAVIELADFHPQLKFAWYCTDGIRYEQARHLRELSRRPQVYCKLASLIPSRETITDKPLTDEVREVAEVLIEHFTPSRLMNASGWNSGMGRVTYPAWLNTVDDLIHNLDRDAQSAIQADTAEEFYKL